MKIPDKAMEVAITACISGVVALCAAIGFSSPKEKMDEHDSRIKGLENNVRVIEVSFGRMDQKLDDLVYGLGVRRRNPQAYRPQ